MSFPTTQDAAYRVEVVRCSRDAQLFRWRILSNGRPIDLPGYAYATAWAAAKAGRVALHWHLALGRRSGPADGAAAPVAPEANMRAPELRISRRLG